MNITMTYVLVVQYFQSYIGVYVSKETLPKASGDVVVHQATILSSAL